MKYLVLFIFLIISCVGVLSDNGITYYISLNSENNDQLCGSTLDLACPSILSALNLIPSSSNKQSATLLLDDGVYSGINNTNLDVFGYNIVIDSLNKNSDKVIFDSSLQQSGKIFSIYDNGQPSPTQQPIVTQLSISNVSFKSTQSGIVDSKIENSTFILEISNCVFDNNSASIVNNSVIHVVNSESNQFDVNITISQSVFTSNSYVMYLSEACNLVIDSCSFIGSTTKKKQDLASVLFMLGGLLEITNSNITQSSVSTAISLYGSYIPQSPVLIKNCIFDSNDGFKGGVFEFAFTFVLIENSIFNNNYAIMGGSIFGHSVPTMILISNCKFTNNKSLGQGGSISFQSSVVSDISNCEFSGNSASSGGSISLEYIDQLNLKNCSFENNNATNRGGAIFTSFGSINFNQTVIQDNSASKGGSIYCASSTLYMPNNTQFSNNVDFGNGTDSYEYNHGAPVLPNDFNIYCALDPTNTYCDIVSTDSTTYASLCGYVDPNQKDAGLSKGQLAGIIIGATLGAAILAFAAAWFISKTTISEHYRSLVKNRSNSHDESAVN